MVLGLTLALMRLSGNLLAAGTSRVLIELIRNTPQLLQIVFFYFAVLQALPQMRQSVTIGTSVFLNVRGLYLPAASGGAWDWISSATIVLVLIAAVVWKRLGMVVPRLLVLAEPTSALDVSVQAQVVDLLRDLQQRHRLAYLFISHDLRVVRALSHRIIVLKDGQVVEAGEAEALTAAPTQPYTRSLMAAAFDLRSETGEA